MNTRSRTESAREPGNETINHSAVIRGDGWKFPYQGQYFGTWSKSALRSLFEVTTSNSTGSRKSPKAFQHYKCRTTYPAVSPLPVSTFYWGGHESGATTATSYQLGLHDDPTFGWWNRTDGVDQPLGGDDAMYLPSEDGFIPIPPWATDLAYDAINSMLPQCKEELSAINFALEFKDISSVLGTVNRFKTYLKSVLKTDFISFDIHLAKRLADLWLQKSFNIDPLISDLKGISTALLSYKKQVNKLVSRTGGVRRNRFRTSHPEDDASTLESPYYRWDYRMAGMPYSHPYLNGSWRTRRVVISDPTVFCCQITYSFSFSDFQLQHAALLGFLDKIGVNFNPRIIWNAMRWTFVIDWVFQVGRWLDQFKVTNLAPMIEIRSFAYSMLRKRRIIRSLDCSINTIGLPQQEQRPVSTTYETAYRRVLTMPTVDSLRVSGLTLKEVSLGLSLAVANWRVK